MLKSELRLVYLAKRRQLPSSRIEAKSRQIAENFFSEVSLAGVEVLHCFLAIKKFNEIDTFGIIQMLWTTFSDLRVAVPKVNSSTGEIESYIFTPETPLVENKWGIREPASGIAVGAEEIGMVLVPGLAFDVHGHRVGYGNGFYDRFLRKCRRDCLKVGLNIFPPVERIDDIHSGDVRLNLSVTPDETFSFGG